MTKTKEAILDEYPFDEIANQRGYDIRHVTYDDALNAMQDYVDQHAASLYTLSEVQKIVENVRKECAYWVVKGAPLSTIKNDINSLDLNQFIIPKK